MRELSLNTVCEEASCPNIGECWKQKHATVMILGRVCTRACTFCNVSTGRPDLLDPHEPERVAEAVRDAWAVACGRYFGRSRRSRGWRRRTISRARSLQIRAAAPGTTIEVLTPDFWRKEGAIETVVAARPDVFNHNLETVPRLYAEVRPGARYFHSLRLLDQVKRRDPAMFTKSGIMSGSAKTRPRCCR